MKINWARFMVGVLVVTLICFFSDGLLHESILGTDWNMVYQRLGANEPEPHGLGLAYFLFFEIGRGILAMTLYVLMRGPCGVGPKTAAWAGFVVWLAFSVTGPAQFIPLGFFSNALWIKTAAYQLVTSIVATLAGAALYKD
jgi:hypothetical protein